MSVPERLYPDTVAVPVVTRHLADARCVLHLGLERRDLSPRALAPLPGRGKRRSASKPQQGSWPKGGSSSTSQLALFDLDRTGYNPGHLSRLTWHKAGINQGFAACRLSLWRINHRIGEMLVPKYLWVSLPATRQLVDIGSAISARATPDQPQRENRLERKLSRQRKGSRHANPETAQILARATIDPAGNEASPEGSVSSLEPGLWHQHLTGEATSNRSPVELIAITDHAPQYRGDPSPKDPRSQTSRAYPSCRYHQGHGRWHGAEGYGGTPGGQPSPRIGPMKAQPIGPAA